eukprot:g12611.t1
MSQLRIGIIGAGGIAAKMHLPEMQTVADAEVVVISGRKQSRLETLCRKFNVPRWTHSYEEVATDPELDGVIVALPHPLHVEWGLRSLDAGKHVYMQKPLSTSLDEADQFVEAADASDRVVFALPYVSTPRVLAARRLAADGALGTISSAHARHSHGGPEVYYAGIQQILEEEADDNLWFFDADKADVGALFDMGVYSIANLVTMVGNVAAVTCRCRTVAKPTRLEDTAALLLDFENGALGTAETGWCDAARSWEFSVHGTAGKVVSPAPDQPLTWYRPSSTVDEDAPLLSETVDTSSFPVMNSHQMWADCIRQGETPELSNARTARHITEIMLAGLESSRTGRTGEKSSENRLPVTSIGTQTPKKKKHALPPAPKKGTPQWYVQQMLVVRLQKYPQGASVEELRKLRRDRNLEIIKLAEEAIRMTAKDPKLEEIFNAVIHQLAESRMVLAMQGQEKDIEDFYEMADALYQRDLRRGKKSKAAAEASYKVAVFANQNALRYPDPKTGWLKEFTRRARLFATNFPEETARAVRLLDAAGRSCEYHNQIADAVSCYEQLRQQFPKLEQARRAEAVLRRLQLLGKSLELSGPTIDGGFVNIRDYRDKVVLIAFWSTGQKSFISMLPRLKALQKSYGRKHFEILGVNLDKEEPPVATFLEKNAVVWPNIFHPDRNKRGWENPMAKHYAIRNLPTLWLVDTSGRVVEMRVDPAKLDQQVILFAFRQVGVQLAIFRNRNMRCVGRTKPDNGEKRFLRVFRSADEIQRGVHLEGPCDPRSTTGRMTPTAYRRLLASTRLTGCWEFGRKKSVWSSTKDYAEQQVQPDEEVAQFQCEDLRIVDDELFFAVQKRLAELKLGPRGPKMKTSAQLWDLTTEFFYCAACSTEEDLVRFYQTGAHGHGMQCKNGDSCPCKSAVRREDAVRAVCEKLQQLIRQDRELIAGIVSRAYEVDDQDDEGLLDEIGQHENRVRALTRKIDGLSDLAGEETVMPRNLPPGAAIMLTMTLLLATGCGSARDERYRRLAEHTLHEQSQQNKRLAEQSKQIVDASQRLVEGDAQSRRDLLEAQKQLTGELHSERAGIDRQREEMEQERRNIAAQRHRDPVIAQAIGAVGLTLACLLPLLLAAYVIRAVNQDGDASAELGKLLVMEMTAEQPLLLPVSSRPIGALEHSPPPEGDDTDGTISSSGE